MSELASFPDGAPLSGWHFVCACGWTAHDQAEPPRPSVEAHQKHHAKRVAAIWNGCPLAPNRAHVYIPWQMWGTQPAPDRCAYCTKQRA